MRIITGDECGLLKEVIPELSRCPDGSGKASAGIAQPATDEGVSRVLENNDVDNGTSKMRRSRGVVGMTFVPPQQNNNDNNNLAQYCALRVDGSVERWQGQIPQNGESTNFKNNVSSKSAGRYTKTHSWNNVFHNQQKEEEKGESNKNVGRPIAIVGSSSSSTNKKVIACCTSMGKVTIMDMFNLEKGVVAQYSAFNVNENNNKITVTKGSFQNRDIATSMAMDPAPESNRIAIGGRERETILLDMETGKQIWKAKNLPRDPQTLLEKPIWGTAIEFLSMDNVESSHSNLLVVGTAYKELRIYDIRASSVQRRPIMFTSDKDKERIVQHRITAVCPLSKSNSIVVGDAAGYMQTVDLRNLKRGVVGRYNGPSGSVRQIVQHESLDILACVGLDRMLRTYDTNNRKMLDCIYLKQRLNSMLFLNDPTWSSSSDRKNAIYGNDNENGGEWGKTSDMDENGDIDQEDDVQVYVDSDEEQPPPNTNGEQNKTESSSSEAETDSSDDDDDDDDDESDDFESDSEDSDIEENVVVGSKKNYNGSKKNSPAAKRRRP
eukprot:CAMPEP_0197827010 /NCGR_PEP_ID=MMETSP1437-20131217/3893_1 /TAXON_ID=49252 ORGANISM="Eucampia antarctica, Strain CCMP1452" /NCGR_SAMPLE_ID=MMETSP1437 /ASSEMBLY_ACC=CAM_ASM_001096 /LENGTH=549 /DNA_ID=CAMNT_0043427707 /DNA_START=23 /DNA_END=1672 /DNA_ORIENTATION=-